MRPRALILALALLAGGGQAAVGDPPVPAAGRRPLRAGRITLLVPPAGAARPELAALAAELDRAAAAMAARLPPAAAGSPVTVAVEPDYVAQARDTGRVGEAVPGGLGGTADLALVWDPRDGDAYRFALAQILLERAGLAKRLAPWLARGAALWLSGGWYGRPWRDWLPLLAAARALPAAADLLAAQEQADASGPLWTPAAAAVIDRLPGATLAAKLAAAPPTASQVEAALAGLTRLPAPPAASRGRATPPTFFRGVSLAMRNSVEDGYHAPGLDERLERLARLGADAVSLMPFAFQPAADQPRLRYLNRGPASETDVGVVHAARAAHARGLSVLYKPHVWVGGGSWPGEIAMNSEADWAAWWAGYRRFVLHHAFVAAWAESDVFSLGCELSQTVGRLAEWRDLIAAVRLFFPGALTYSANWGEDLDRVRFWDRLDLVGVDAYYPLSASPAASPRDLDRGAAAVVKKLAAAARREGRPVLLTEVGFAARKGAWTAPSEEGGDYSEEDQEASYAALFRALGRPSWLAGTFVWKAFSGGEDRPDRRPRSAGGARQADFRFLGRRAESAIAAYYGGAAMPAARP